MVILALLMDAPIIEIPLNYRGRVGESKITGRLSGTLRTGTMMLLIIAHIKVMQLTVSGSDYGWRDPQISHPGTF